MSGELLRLKCACEGGDDEMEEDEREIEGREKIARRQSNGA